MITIFVTVAFGVSISPRRQLNFTVSGNPNQIPLNMLERLVYASSVNGVGFDLYQWFLLALIPWRGCIFFRGRCSPLTKGKRYSYVFFTPRPSPLQKRITAVGTENFCLFNMCLRSKNEPITLWLFTPNKDSLCIPLQKECKWEAQGTTFI